MTFWTTTRRVGAHIVGAVCVVAVGLLAQHPAGTAPDQEPARLVGVEPRAMTLTCPSPATLRQEGGGDEQFDATPVDTVSELTAAGRTADVVALGSGEGTARVLRVPPGGSAAATATSITSAGDLRGLVAGRCQAPAVEHWLVGGSSDVGSSSRLVLQNPGRTAASVSLTVWGSTGPLILGSRAAVVVPPGEQVETTLEAIVPEQRRVVVQAVSRGARVNAYLQHHRIDGLVPQGADLVVGGAAPTSSLAVVGVTSRGESVTDEHGPVLRLLAPGNDDGSARVSVYGADGREWPRGLEKVPLAAGAVTDVPLGGLPEGRYTLAVDATVPVVGAGLVHRRGAAASDAVVDGAPYDTAWIPGQSLRPTVGQGGAAEVREAGAPAAPLVAVPATAWSLNIGAIPADRDDDADAEGTVDVTVTGYTTDGDKTGTTNLTLPAGKNATLSGDDLKPLGDDVAAISVSSLSPSGDATTAIWSLLLTAKDGLIATLTPPESTPSQNSVPIRDVPAN